MFHSSIFVFRKNVRSDKYVASYARVEHKKKTLKFWGKFPISNISEIRSEVLDLLLSDE
jgi:hypothetical protein